MTDHTPTPFPALLSYRVREDGSIFMTAGDPMSGCHTAFDIFCSEANAAFIVRAVNAHDDLVSTSDALVIGLEMLLDRLGIDGSTSIIVRKAPGSEVIAEVALETLIANSKAALSKAGGENA